MPFTQSKRLLAVSTPLGDDAMFLTGFTGTEALSRLFVYHLEMFSEQEDIDPTSLVGQSVTWSVGDADDKRYFNGYVSRLTAGALNPRGIRTYHADVVPWLWFLTRSADCRIYQQKSVPDIIKAVFDDLSFSDYKLDLQGSYSPRDYCVQYRETAFNFVSRLMEHEGIFYYFTHEQGKHTLVLADAASSCPDCKENEVAYAGTGKPLDLTSWEHQYEYRSGKWTHTDYNFETPSTSLVSNANTVLTLSNISNYELFDYPGDYLVKDDGTSIAKVRIEEDEAGYEVVVGAGACCTFSPGCKFTLTDHSVQSEAGKSYVLASVQHSGTDYSHLNTDQPSEYHNQFTCIPSSVNFRPPRVTPKPLVQGPQTAVVVGTSGEEIYTDQYGRIKVQFFWDRKGQNDEKSSCWIRVVESWAGKQWGTIFLPRIGQEVVVDFLEGDPDRPLVTGRVYNAEQMPPYTLPDNKTQSGVKTRSSKGGGDDNCNELRFEDKMGSEDIVFHAEKDFHRSVEHDDDLQVGNDQTITITNNRTEEVKQGNESVTIDQGNRTVTVKQGNDTHDIKQGDRKVTIEMGNDNLKIQMGNQTVKLDMGASSTEAMQSITLKVGQNSITIDQTGVTIKGMLVSIQGEIQTQVKGTMTQINGDAMLQMQGGITMIN
jgi:type VI secretion system secreted protein VgrG